MTAPAGGHERIYRGLLRLYPADYRARFSGPMVQLFGDQLRADGTARTWLRSSTDLITSAASEHLRRNRTVAHSMTLSPTPASRILGILGVIGGGVLLLGFLGFTFTPDQFNLRLVLFNVGAVAVAVGVHIRQATAGRLLSLSAVIPAILSNLLYLVLIVRSVAQPGEIGPGDYQPVALFTFAGIAMWLSDAWFGAVAFRLGVVSRIAALALIVGSFFAIIGMGIFGLVTSGSAFETLVLGGIGVHGVAWVLLGLDIAFLRRQAPPISPA
ncbi:MAG: hypothetical protein ABI797_00385 [Chloroflexota bacterium]